MCGPNRNTEVAKEAESENNKGPVGPVVREAGERGSLQLGQAHLFVQLLAPALDALGGQLRLAIFVDAQTDEVLVVHQCLEASNS